MRASDAYRLPRSIVLASLVALLASSACGETFTSGPGTGGTGTGATGTGATGAGGTSTEGGGGAGAAAGTGGGTAGSGGGLPGACVPADSPGIVDDSCGIFVRLEGDDANPGTKELPKKTIAGALAVGGAKGARIYLCTEAFGEAVTITHGVRIFGGLDCSADWAYVGQPGDKASEIDGPADLVTVTVGPPAAITVHIDDIRIIAPSAVNHGKSSIGVLALDGTDLTLLRCEIRAGDGRTGGNGGSPQGTGDGGMLGGNGVVGCTAPNPVAPAPPPVLACGNNWSSAGGTGGIGDVNSGGNGQQGTSNPPPDSANDNSGAGQTSGVSCTAGKQGLVGSAGSGGPGATGVGGIGPAGYIGPVASTGSLGEPGQGGGGGGGARGASVCTNGLSNSGPAGAGGGGGGPAGSSIAIVSRNAAVTVKDCTVQTGSGGTGGTGGAGQAGGPGANGGTGAAAANGGSCEGGKGGAGGMGGGGGGGLGGHSIGIAYVGTLPSIDGGNIVPSTAGPGGAGGPGANANGNGANGQGGVSSTLQPFASAD